MNQAVDTTELSHRYLRVEGQRIHCVVAGSGEPVLLVPGWPQTWYAWRHVMQALAAQGFMAIAVDPPGLGDSDRPEQGYDTGSVARTLHQVMAQLGFNRYHLVGHDVGMWIAYALACDVVTADGRHSQVELRMLEEVREELLVDRLHAAAIEWGARVRHLKP